MKRPGSRTAPSETGGARVMYITEETLRQAGILVRDRQDRLMLLHILNKALEERVGSVLCGRLDPTQRAELEKKRPEELAHWFFKTFPDHAEVVEDCARTILEELREDSS